MYFSTSDIYSTPAEAMVVPIRLGTNKITPLQKRVIDLCGKDYIMDLMEDIKHGSLATELPSFYIPPKGVSSLIVINFPIPVEKTKPGDDLSDMIVNFRALFGMCEAWNIRSFALGVLGNGVGWDQLEDIVMRMEATRLAQMVEVWYHPPREKDDDVVQIEAEVVNA